MFEEPYKMSITGTIRKNKREIPAEMKVSSKTIPDSKFCFSDKITLLSHTPKKNKIVLLVSTFLTSDEVTEGKPNMIRHYNKTKGGTDNFDKLCHSFSTARRTRRWPLRFFFGMLDQSAVNARILLSCKNVNEGKSAVTADFCLNEIIKKLVEPTLQERFTMITIRKDIRYGIAGILGIDVEDTSDENKIIQLDHYARCLVCPRNKDRKTKTACCACKRPMCNDHRSALCTTCASMDD